MSTLSKLQQMAARGDIDALRAACTRDKQDINWPNARSRETALHTAVRYGNGSTAYVMLKELGANPQLRNRGGERAIDLAVRDSDPATLSMLAVATHPKAHQRLNEDKDQQRDEIQQSYFDAAELRRLVDHEKKAQSRSRSVSKESGEPVRRPR